VIHSARSFITLLVACVGIAVVAGRSILTRESSADVPVPRGAPEHVAVAADSAVVIVYADSRPGHLLMTQPFGARVVYEALQAPSPRALLAGAANVPVAAVQAFYPDFDGLRDVWSHFVSHRFHGGNQVQVWGAIASNRDASLIVSAGDAVPDGSREQGWQEFERLTEDVRARVPYAIAPGNHEELWSAAGRANWDAHFGAPPCVGQYWRCVWLDTLAKFVLLDSNVLDDREHYAAGPEHRLANAELAWADSVLALPSRHAFVVLHHPLVTAGPHMESWLRHERGTRLDRRAQLLRILRRHHVTAVFGGHEHLYLRAFVAHDGEPGFWHVTTGGGGSPLHRVSDVQRTRVARQTLPEGSRIEWVAPERSMYEFCRLVVSSAGVDLRVYGVDTKGAVQLVDRSDLSRPPAPPSRPLASR
jgi:3',5'-cyclic AMP phosphodiesterase CpdA